MSDYDRSVGYGRLPLRVRNADRTGLLNGARGVFRASWVLSLVGLCWPFFGGSTQLGAQIAPATLPNFQLSKGASLWSVAVQNDGKLILGGFFGAVNGAPRRNLARLNVDGTLDETWDPGADRDVRRLVISGTDVFVLGDFSQIGGQPRAGLAKLSTLGPGVADPIWNPPLANNLYAMLADGTNLYVGGYQLLVRLSTTGAGAVDPAWNPTPDYNVMALALDGGGTLYVGGDFAQLDGLARGRLAKVSTRDGGTVDPLWNPEVAGGNLGYVATLLLNDSDLYAGGSFDRVGGWDVKNLVKLGTDGAGDVDASWTPQPDNFYGGAVVYALSVVGPDLYVAGNFDTVGNENRRNIARVSLASPGVADPTWAPEADQWVAALASIPDAIYVGGAFESIGGQGVLSLAKLDPASGRSDPAWPAQVSFPGSILTLARQADGKIIVGGDFYLAGASPHSNLARLSADGTIDSLWSPDADGPVTKVVVSGSDIFVAGRFTSVGGQARNGLAKLETTGTGAADSTWDPEPDGPVTMLAASEAGLFVGGRFLNIGGQYRPYLAKLSPTSDGAADGNWDAGVQTWAFRSAADSPVRAMAVTAESVYVAGDFWQIGGMFRNGFAKLDANGLGAGDPAWDPTPDGTVSSLTLSDTGLLVAGLYSSIGGQNRINLARVDLGGVGAADSTWNPILNGAIGALAVVGTNLYVGGQFTTLDGQGPSNLARVSLIDAGALDAAWIPNPDGGIVDLLARGNAVFASGDFTSIGGQSRHGLAQMAVADAPAMSQSSNSIVFIQRNPADGPEVSHFRIVGLTGGNLYQSDGSTPISVRDFITVAEGVAGLRFVPSGPGGSVTALSALNATPAGAGLVASTLVLSVVQHAPSLRLSASTGLEIIGTSGSAYQIEFTDSLSPPVHWTPLSTVTLPGTSLVMPYTSPTNSGQRFYHALLVR